MAALQRFTEGVRAELAHAPVGRRCCRLAETAALVRIAGALHRSGPDARGAGGTGFEVTVADGAVARRLHGALVGLFHARPEIAVHAATTLRGTRYRLVLPQPVEPLLRDLGILDAAGHLMAAPPARMVAAPHDAGAYVRGALMAGGSLSDPRRAAHLELRTNQQASAEQLRDLVARCGGEGARAAPHDLGWRVTCKSSAAIAAVLARVGAHAAFLRWDAARLQRELRATANRAANADRANLGRAVAASARQVRMIQAVVAEHGFQGLHDDLRATALARLANPEATLAELGDLHDPPVGKATVHRRLARLEALASAGGSPQTAG